MNDAAFGNDEERDILIIKDIRKFNPDVGITILSNKPEEEKLQEKNIPYVAIDTNTNAVILGREQGLNAVYLVKKYQVLIVYHLDLIFLIFIQPRRSFPFRQQIVYGIL